MALPSEYTFGKVVTRIVQAVADGTDEDRFPDMLAAGGTVIFKPKEKNRKTVNYSALVLNQNIRGTLYVPDPNEPEELHAHPPGTLLDSQGNEGVWLVTGNYTAEFQLNEGSFPPLEFTLTDDNDSDNPLDLIHASPTEPPQGVIMVQADIPPGGRPNQTLVREESGNLAWRDFLDEEFRSEFISYRDQARTARNEAREAADKVSQEVEESSPYRGALTSESPIDEYRTEDHDGWYRVTSAAVATGLGLPEIKRGIFTVKWILGSLTSGNAVQTFITSDGHTWNRVIPYTGSTWTEWSMESFAQGPSSPTDLNDYKTPLTRALPAPYPSGYQNAPPGNTTASILNVWSSPGNQWAAQEVFQYGSDPRRWWRISRSFTEWNDWVELEALPHHEQLDPLPLLDTGWRNVTNTLTYGWTGGEIYIRRTSDEVMFVFKALDGTEATSPAVIPLPTGFQPDMFTGGSQAFYVRGDTEDIWGSAGTGFMRLQAGWKSRTGTWSSIRIPAEPTPPDLNNLPGTPRD